MNDPFTLPVLKQVAQPSIADQVFNAMQKRILTLELPPGTKLSETEVAARMGVSRQPVREAFKRLAKLGFLLIRPQSGTSVSLISEAAVLRARYIRLALEMQTCKTACATVTPDGLEALAGLIDRQVEAVDAGNSALFHSLDDQFHKEICVTAGVGYVWELIHDNKAHMDRIRMLTLDGSTQRHALKEHMDIFDAISSRNPDAAEVALTRHLSRILDQIAVIKAQNHNWFTDGDL